MKENSCPCKKIFRSANSILEGMAVTLSWMFRPPVTVQWPDKIERPLEETLPETYRGLLEVDLPLCTGCQMCQRSCPIACLAIDLEKNTETKERFLVRFDVDAAKCMYCGLCVEACPTGAIRHTTRFAATQREVAALVLRYIPEGKKIPPAKPSASPPPQPRGSLVDAVLPCRSPSAASPPSRGGM